MGHLLWHIWLSHVTHHCHSHNKHCLPPVQNPSEHFGGVAECVGDKPLIVSSKSLRTFWWCCWVHWWQAINCQLVSQVLGHTLNRQYFAVPPTVHMDSTEVHLKVEGPGGMESTPLHSTQVTQVNSSPLKGRGGMESTPVQSTPLKFKQVHSRVEGGMESSPVHVTVTWCMCTCFRSSLCGLHYP